MVTTAGTVVFAAFTKSSPTFAEFIPANFTLSFAVWKYEKSLLFSFVLKYSIAPKVVAPDNIPTTAKGNNCFKLFFIVNSSFIV